MIALFRGTSFLSRAIRWVTRGDYSHAAWITRNGSCIEAWTKGVREVPSISFDHTPGTTVEYYEIRDMTEGQRVLIEHELRRHVGDKARYDFWGAAQFVPLFRATHDLVMGRGDVADRWFCSEFILGAMDRAGCPPLVRVEAWKVAPVHLSWSPQLIYVGKTVTKKEATREVIAPNAPVDGGPVGIAV